MRTWTLRRADDDLVWEATQDGSAVEIALGPEGGADEACRIETLTFDSPLAAREHVTETIERLLGEGFEALAPKPAVSAGATSPPVDLARLFRMTDPRSAEHPELVAALQAAPDDEEGYLVYADWLQEQGDPRGELIVIQHAARRSGELRRVADRVIERFAELLVPSCCRSGTVSLRWRLGFIEGAHLLTGEDEFVDHPSSALLRELSANATALCEALLAGRRLPCLRALKLDTFVGGVTDRQLQKLLQGPHLPALRQLSLRDVDDGARALAPVVASGRLADLELIDLACDMVRDDRRLRWVVDKCGAIPAGRKPKLCLTLPPEDYRDGEHDPDALDRLRGVFACVEPDALPRCFALADDRRHDADEEETDLLDRLCGVCGTQMDTDEPICPACGHDHWEDDDVWEDRDADDADSRDNEEDRAVDRRWEAFKDDVFDIDD